MNKLIEDVIEWGRERGLHETNDLMPQLTKLTEELGEVAAGVARNDHNRIIDGIGDMLVVMVNLGEVFNKRFPGQFDEGQSFLEGCLGEAWAEIAARTGRTVNGVFVKDEEPE